MNERLVVFAGPTLHDLQISHTCRHEPPLGRGGMDDLGQDDVAVVIDGVFGPRAAASHVDYTSAIRRGVQVVGASSIGAVRAVELRALGMRGVGQVYDAYLAGNLRDDGELAVAMHPTEMSATTVPLVDVRARLGAVAAKSPRDLPRLNQALEIARNTYFMERTNDRLIETWSQHLPDLLSTHPELLAHRPEDSVKYNDALRAINVGAGSLGLDAMLPEPRHCELLI